MNTINRLALAILLAGGLAMAGTTTGHAKTEIVVTCTASLQEVQTFMWDNHRINIVSYDEGLNKATDDQGKNYRMIFGTDCSIVGYEDLP